MSAPIEAATQEPATCDSVRRVIMSGFPPPREQRWSLANWQQAPVNRWAFQHLREIVPTARVGRSPTGPRVLESRPSSYDDPLVIPHRDGSSSIMVEVLEDMYTDGFLVMSGGVIVAEQYFNDMSPATTHLLMSVSKSIIGCVCAVLTEMGDIELDAPLTTYIPEFGGRGYDGATVRHLLDMRSGIAFSEEYLDLDAEVRLLEQVIGWAPRTMPDLPHSMYEWLTTLKAKGPHGGPFEYRSCETDVLGWVCERASGERMPDLLTAILWDRLGTEYDMDAGIDPVGAVMHDGGLSATLRDLGRFGQMIADRGSVDGRRVVPTWWIEDALRGGPDSRAAFAASGTDDWLPGGMYRNQFWVPYPDEEVLLCLGIHGQMVYVDLGRNVVVVKLSSWPNPEEAIMFDDTLTMTNLIASSLVEG